MLKFLFAILFVLLSFASCKKDNNNLVADFTANFRKINKGEKITFTDKSRNNPDKWYWIFNGGTPSISEDQNPQVIYNSPGIYTVSLTVKNSSDNNALTKIDYIEVVNFSCGNNIIDNRDGNVYQTVTINNRCWLSQNLNTGVFNQSNNLPSNNNVIEKLCFNNGEANCLIYGALYQWNEMMKYNSSAINGICPIGYTIPSKLLFDDLINYAGGASLAGGKLKQNGTALWEDPNTGATDEFGFNALPSGYYENSVFLNINRNTVFWTSDDFDTDNSMAVLLSSYNAQATDTVLNKGIAASVRCIKNL